MRLKEWLFKVYKKSLTVFGDIYFATKPPLVKAKEIRDALDILKPGDIICRGYNYYLDSYFIPGEYSHSGLVTNENYMTHSIAEGVCGIDTIDFIKDCDAFIVIRPQIDDADIIPILARAHEHENLKSEYDFTFKDPNKFYCHEFTADCLNYGGVTVLPTDKEFGIWPFKFKRTIFLAQNLIDTCKVIYEFNPEGGKK
jgi:hypothetical protein